jgi:hypothetical protein
MRRLEVERNGNANSEEPSWLAMMWGLQANAVL